MSKSGHSFRLSFAAGLTVGFVTLGGCASSSPRDDFFQVRSVVYDSRPGDGTVVMSGTPGPQIAAKLARKSAPVSVVASADRD